MSEESEHSRFLDHIFGVMTGDDDFLIRFLVDGMISDHIETGVPVDILINGIFAQIENPKTDLAAMKKHLLNEFMKQGLMDEQMRFTEAADHFQLFPDLPDNPEFYRSGKALDLVTDPEMRSLFKPGDQY